MRRQIIRMYILTATVGLLVALLLSLAIAQRVYGRSLEQRLDDALVHLGSLTDLELSEPIVASSPPSPALERIALILREQGSAMRFSLLDSEARVLADSTPEAGLYGDSRADRPEVVEALAGRRGLDRRQSATSPRAYLYAAVRRGPYILRAALPADESWPLTRLLLLGFALCLLAGFAASYLIGRRIASRLVSPIQRLTATAEAIADGDYGSRVEPYPDELGQLGRAFNRMAGRVEATQSALVEHNAQLETIIRGLSDGIVAVSEAGEVVLLSPRTTELLGPYDARHRRLESFGQNYAQVARLAASVQQARQPLSEELAIGYPQERDLLLHGQPIPLVGGATGVLLVISDMTRLRQLEQLRRDFVANVTHELKTPLTSIRGYIELLRSGSRDEATRQQFYEIIEIESERLANLITDVLELSEIETRGRASLVQDARCSVDDAVAELLERMGPIAAEAQVELVVELPEGLVAPTSPGRMQQLLGNLVANAIFYNRPGGHVWLRGEEDGRWLTLSVEDDGIGIAPEHQGRLFERFYRVHRERSRALGGTGLGLSIVKHIVSLYGGQIALDSEEGRGSTFTIRLPRVSGEAT